MSVSEVLDTSDPSAFPFVAANSKHRASPTLINPTESNARASASRAIDTQRVARRQEWRMGSVAEDS